MTQPSATQPAADTTAIRPFQVSFPEAEIADLRRRVNTTRWPEHELSDIQSSSLRAATGARSSPT